MHTDEMFRFRLVGTKNDVQPTIKMLFNQPKNCSRELIIAGVEI